MRYNAFLGIFKLKIQL